MLPYLPLLPVSLILFSVSALAVGPDHVPASYVLWALFSFAVLVKKDLRGKWLTIDTKRAVTSKVVIISWALVLAGITFAFVFLDLTATYSDVRYPLIFTLLIPITEEIIFRGWVFEISDRVWGASNRLIPVFMSATLFGLHHLQYYGFHLGRFALFQVAYTILLGLALGHLRWKTGSIYAGLVLHIGMNTAVYLC